MCCFFHIELDVAFLIVFPQLGIKKTALDQESGGLELSPGCDKTPLGAREDPAPAFASIVPFVPRGWSP